MSAASLYTVIPAATLPAGWATLKDGRALGCGGFVVRALALSVSPPTYQMVAAWEGPDGRLDLDHAHVEGADFFGALRAALADPQQWRRVPPHLRARLAREAALVVVADPAPVSG